MRSPETNYNSNPELEPRLRKISLFKQIEEGLKSDGRVFLAGVVKHQNFGGTVGGVEIFVAPRSSIYDINNLNRFMETLVPSISRTQIDKAEKKRSSGDVVWGRLNFDEKVGEQQTCVSTITTAIDMETMIDAGFSLGKRSETRTREIKRSIVLRVFPEIGFARRMADYKNKINTKQHTIKPVMDDQMIGVSYKHFESMKRKGERTNDLV